MTATATQFVAKAASQIGYREGYDPIRGWNNDNKYGIWYGWNGVAWCAQFVSWCANEVGALGTIVPKYQSTFSGLTWFRNRDQTGYWPPRPGDIFMMCEYNPGAWNDVGNGWATIHTGIVEKYLGDGRVQTIEGNTNTTGSSQGNGVYRLIRNDSQDGKRFIYARPKWATTTTTPVPPVVTQPELFGEVYTGSREIDVSRVRPGYRNTPCDRFNGLLWSWLCKNSRAYAEKNVALWKTEADELYGLQSQRATQEMYRILAARQPQNFSRVSLPTWPGPAAVRAIGGKPI